LETIDYNIEIWLKEAENTHTCGKSLADSIYTTPVTILLSGEIGSGKTTFLNGFSEALGIQEDIPSPTFALEHHHKTKSGAPFLHIDLYRLSGKEAEAFVEQTGEFEGFRCIEWTQHLSRLPAGPTIAISLEDTNRKQGHRLECTFHDVPLPGTARILAWREELELPHHISAHCDTVADLAVEFGRHILKEGTIVRLNALKVAGQLHDLLRFVDFPVEGSAQSDSPTEPAIWERVREQYSGLHHEGACAAFLRKNGFAACADIVEVHGLSLPPNERRTIEQKLLYYADKRVSHENVVSLEERFAEFTERYKGRAYMADADIWFGQAKELEKELFGKRPPR